MPKISRVRGSKFISVNIGQPLCDLSLDLNFKFFHKQLSLRTDQTDVVVGNNQTSFTNNEEEAQTKLPDSKGEIESFSRKIMNN